MIRWLKVFAPILAIFVSNASFPMERSGVRMLDDLRYQGKRYRIQGMGTHGLSALVTTVDMFVAGLYLPKSRSKRNKDHAVLVVHWVYELNHKNLVSQLRDAFEKSCKPNCAVAEDGFDDFSQALEGFEPGDRLVMVFSPEKVMVQDRGHNLGDFRGPFVEILYRMFVRSGFSEEYHQGIQGHSKNKK